MPLQLSGRFLTRGRKAVADRCPIARAMQVVGTRSAILLMREALYGTTRFDDFAARVGISEAIASKRLRELVDAGLLTREPYQDAGKRTRHEYVLTRSGQDLAPVVFALAQWGSKYVPRAGTPTLSHAECGAPVHAALRCAEDHRLSLEDIMINS